MSDVRDLSDRAWRGVAAIDAAYERGDLDDVGWARSPTSSCARISPCGAAAVTPGPPKTGSTRGVVAELMDPDLTFLDIGCANGLSSVVRANAGIAAFTSLDEARRVSSEVTDTYKRGARDPSREWFVLVYERGARETPIAK